MWAYQNPRIVRIPFHCGHRFDFTSQYSHSFVFVAFSFLGLPFTSLSPLEFTFCVFLLLSSYSISIFEVYFLGKIKTEVNVASRILSSLAKMSVKTVTVFMPSGFIGAALGFIASALTNIVIFVWNMKKYVKTSGYESQAIIFRGGKLMKAGTAEWIPRLLPVFGE